MYKYRFGIKKIPGQSGGDLSSASKLFSVLSYGLGCTSLYAIGWFWWPDTESAQCPRPVCKVLSS